MVMIVGLGNPGARYAGTRHNVGFDTLDVLASRHGIPVESKRHRAWIGQGMIGDCRVLLAKPATYMNLSGEAVGALSRYYHVAPRDIWVVVDDVALPIGTLRLRSQGSSGGHHGLESIELHLGTRQFPRIRIGIGGSGQRDLVEHVLSRFSAEERGIITDVVAGAADAIETALAHGFETAMNRFNGVTYPEPQEKADES